LDGQRHYLISMRVLSAVLFGILAFAGTAVAQAPRQIPGTTVVIPPPPPSPQPLPVPGAPRKIDSFGDRAARCVHHGTAFGVPPGQIGQYTRECAQGQ
jgi:hypothetical protein